MRRLLVGLWVVTAFAPPASAAPLLVEPFEDPLWHEEEWVDWRADDEEHTSIVPDGFRQSGLLVHIHPNARRGAGPFYRFVSEPDELWFRYHLYLDDWRPTDSGKLPGLDGIYNFTGKGCLPSTEEYPGWSARLLFSKAGDQGAGPDEVRLGYYTYHLDQPGSCGEWMLWEPGIIGQRRWYCVQGHLRLNDPGSSNGLLEGWLDGVPAFRREGMAFRRPAEEQIHIRSFWLNVYFGGSTIVNDRDLHLLIDELEVDPSGPVPCLTRFTDDDGDPHEPDIEYLFAEGLVNGCAQNLFCPDRLLTRGEVFAILDRALRPAKTTADHFTDDDGLWYEEPANRLAEANVLRGCADGLSCGNDLVSRAQLAAMLDRAFRFDDAAADHFHDDDGIVFEASINRLAEIGVTRGCGEGHFCPYDTVTRAQAATLLARAVRWASNN